MTLPAGAARLVIEWGSAGAGLELPSGDLGMVAPFAGGALCAVIDGLGHGVEAAEAARVAASVLEEHAGEHVVQLVHRCHDALGRTRGAVMSLAAFDAASAAMTWIGVGNVEAALFRADVAASKARADLVNRAGVVGYQLPPLVPATLPVSFGDVLLMGTDGLRGGFAEGPMPVGDPQEIAGDLLRRYARGTDDALVLVARYIGGPPWTSG
jgi:hypothetical protein